jgi:hypothetical protein
VENTENQGFETHGGGFYLCSQASALGGFADLKQLAHDL